MPTAQTPAKARKVSLKQFGPKHEILCCFAASLSYKYPARRPEKRRAPRGFPRDMKLKIIPKFFNPNSSEAVGTMIEN